MKIAGKAVTALLLAALMIMMLPVSAFAANDGKVWLAVSEDDGTTAMIVADTLVTDGLVVVTYDSEKLTYVGVETEAAYVAMHAVNAEEPGVVKISWVAPGRYETDGNPFCLIRVLFEGVAEGSAMVLTGAAHNAAGEELSVGDGPDITELRKAILEAEGLDSEDYTEESFAAVEEALAEAEAVLADGTASQAEIDAATNALRDAILALELKPDPTEPEPTEPETTEPEPTEPETTEPETTEPETTEPETTGPETTEPEITEPETTEPEITEPTEAVVDKDELKKAIAVAEGLNSEKYTEETFNAVENALAAAQDVLADEDAAQDEVDAAAKALRDAIAALELLPTVTPGTGDETPIGMFAAIAVISVAAMAVVVMNKRRYAR